MTNLSARPTFIVERDRALLDSSAAQIGSPGPLSRGRLVFALPTNRTGPVQVTGNVVLRFADPDGNVIGVPQRLWIHRLLYAGSVTDTRRL